MIIEATKPAKASKADPYWEARKDSIYLYVARAICRKYGAKAASVIDVGSNQTPTLEWHRPSARRLVSLDLRRPYVADGVESLTRDFFGYLPEERFDMATCFQVLEHVNDPAAFADKLLAISRLTVVSVPFKWERGRCKYHLHDPVDEAKMLDWFGKKPIYTYVARELDKVARLIQVYRNSAD